MISICIPTYNPNLFFLKETLISCIRQTVNDIEILVNDDNSENYDDILKLISSLNDSRIKFKKNNVNFGMVGNWNIAVDNSIGNYILLLGQDDFISRKMCEFFLKEFNDNDISLCSSAREFIDTNSEVFKRKVFFNDRKYIFNGKNKYILDSKVVTKLALSYGNVIGEPSCVMYKKSDFIHIGGYSKKFSHAADLDFNLRLLKNTNKMVYINRPLLKRRIHSNNLTNDNYVKGYVSNERETIFINHKDNYTYRHETINIFKSYIFLCSLLDIVKSFKTMNFKLLVKAMISLAKYFTCSPNVYTLRFKEFIFKRNLMYRDI